MSEYPCEASTADRQPCPPGEQEVREVDEVHEAQGEHKLREVQELYLTSNLYFWLPRLVRLFCQNLSGLMMCAVWIIDPKWSCSTWRG